MPNFKKRFSKQGFTLVELIIVLAIVAVVALGAFLIVTKRLSHSKDARKIADIETISKTMFVWLTDLDNETNALPKPDNASEIRFDEYFAWTQGGVGTGVVYALPGLTKVPLNPSTRELYTYSRTIDGRKFQITVELENGEKYSSLANIANAEKRVNAVRGNFNPGVYLLKGEGEEYVAVYIPSIIVANDVMDMGSDGTNQYFVFDGSDNNLIESKSNLVVYKDATKSEKDLGILWKGDDLTELKDPEIAKQIAGNLSGTDLSIEEIEKELEKIEEDGGIPVFDATKAIAGEESVVDSYVPPVTPQNCEATEYNGYLIPKMFNQALKTIVKEDDPVNGKTELSVYCTDSQFVYGAEVIVCDDNYVKTSSGLCIEDTCDGKVPAYAVINGGLGNSTRQYSESSGVCKFKCQEGYTYNSGENTCEKNTWETGVFSECTQTCGGGTKTRTVECMNENGDILEDNKCTDAKPAETTSCNVQACIYTVSGVYAYGKGAKVNTCGKTVTADNEGNFMAQVSGGKDCSDIKATREGYICNTTVNGPEILEGDISNIEGECLFMHTVSGNYGADGGGAIVNVCGTNATADANGKFTAGVAKGSTCNNITAIKPGFTCTTSQNGPETLDSNYTSVEGVCSRNNYTVSFDRSGGSGGTSSVSTTYGLDMEDISVPSRTSYIFDGYYATVNGGTKYFDETGKNLAPYDIPNNGTLYARRTPNFKTSVITPRGTADLFAENLGASTYTDTRHKTQCGRSGGVPAIAAYDNMVAKEYFGGGSEFQWAGGVTAIKNGACRGPMNSTDYTKLIEAGVPYNGYMVVAGCGYSNKEPLGSPRYISQWRLTSSSGGNALSSSYAASVGLNTSNIYVLCLKDMKYGDEKVNFDGNGGDVSTSAVRVIDGEPFPTIGIPTKTGYKFEGYFTEEEGGVKYINEDGTSAKNYDLEDGTTLYAQWTIGVYTVTLNPNGGSGGTATTDVTYLTKTEDIEIPTKTGYRFLGYYTATTGGVKYINEDGTAAKVYDKGSDIVLYAQRGYRVSTARGEADLYGVKIQGRSYTDDVHIARCESIGGVPAIIGNGVVTAKDYFGGAVEFSWADGTMPMGGACSGTATSTDYNNFIKAGLGSNRYIITTGCGKDNYEAKGQSRRRTDWYMGNISNGGSYAKTAYTNSFSVSSGRGGYVLCLKNVTKGDYEVTFDGNTGSTAGGSSSSVLVSTGKEMPTISIPTKKGYKFTGYFTEAEGGVKYINEDGTSAKNYNFYDSTTLYAQRSIGTYTITFNANGGSLGTATTDVTYLTNTEDITIPTRADYRFLGYFNSQSGGTQYIDGEGKSVKEYDYGNDKTFYAQRGYIVQTARGEAHLYEVQLSYSRYRDDRHRTRCATIGGVPAIIGNGVVTAKDYFGGAVEFSWADGTMPMGGACSGTATTTDKNNLVKAGVTGTRRYVVTTGCGNSNLEAEGSTRRRVERYMRDIRSGGSYKKSEWTTQMSPASSRGARILCLKNVPKGEHKVTFDGNTGSTGGGSSSSVLVSNGQEMPRISVPTKKGYFFQGYFTEREGGLKYYNGDGTGSKNYDLDEPLTLYAQRNIGDYTITFNANGGTLGTTSTTVTYLEETENIIIPTRSEYRFLGYFDSQNGGTKYINGDGTAAKAFDKGVNTTLYAQRGYIVQTARGEAHLYEVQLSYSRYRDDRHRTRCATIGGVPAIIGNGVVTAKDYFGGAVEFSWADGTMPMGGACSGTATSTDKNNLVKAGVTGTRRYVVTTGCGNSNLEAEGSTRRRVERYMRDIRSGGSYKKSEWTTQMSPASSRGARILCLKNVPKGEHKVTFDGNTGSTGGGSSSSVLVSNGQEMPRISVPTKKGYFFQGYFTEREGGLKYYNGDGTGSKNYDLDEPVTLYAQRNIGDYTITFNANGGTLGTTSTTVTYLEETENIIIPTRSEYRFLGYFDSQNGGTKYINGDGTAAKAFDKGVNTTLYAQRGYIVQTARGEAHLYEVQLSYSRYRDDRHRTRCATIGGVPAIIGNGVVTAKDYFGGAVEFSWADGTMPMGGACSGTATSTDKNNLVKAGVTGTRRYVVTTGCGNSNLEAEGSTRRRVERYMRDIRSGGSYKKSEWTTQMSPASSRGARILCLKNVPKGEHKVTFDANGGSIGTTISSSVLVSNGQEMPRIKIPTKTGYKFMGYFTATSGGTKYYNEDGTSTKNYDLDSATTLYAQRTIGTYTVTLNKNGGSGGTASTTVVYLQNIADIEVPTRSEYRFLGYYNSQNGGTQYIKEDGTAARTFNIGGNTTLYAQWGYKVQTARGEAHLYGTRLRTRTYTDYRHMTRCSETGGVPAIVGYETVVAKDYYGGATEFKWNDGNIMMLGACAGSASGTDYNNLVKAGVPTSRYIITTGCGSNNQEAQSQTRKLVERRMSTINGGGSYNKTARSTSLSNSDRRAYVLCLKNVAKGEHKVTFNANGGSIGNTISSSVLVSNGQEMPRIKIPTKTGYKFMGYFTATSGGTKYYNEDGTSTKNYDLDSATTLYAQRTIGTYTVTLNKNGGSGGTASTTVVYLQNIADIEVPTRSEYRFLGYYNSQNGGTQYIKEDGTAARTFNIGGNTTLYAQWGYKVQTARGEAHLYGTRLRTRTYTDYRHMTRCSETGGVPAIVGYETVVAKDYYGGATEFKWNDGNIMMLGACAGSASGTDYNNLVKAGVPTSRYIITTGCGSNNQEAQSQTRKLVERRMSTINGGGSYNKTARSTSLSNSDRRAYVLCLKNVAKGEHKVTFNANGGSIGNTISSSVLVSNGQAMPRIKIPTRSGYTFKGYYTSTSGGTQYYTSSGTSARTYGLSSATTLYAQWNVGTYTVSFNRNGGTGGTSSTTATYLQNMPTITPPTKDGYTFNGYYNATSGGTKYYNANGTSARTYNIGGGTTLYAQWTYVPPAGYIRSTLASDISGWTAKSGSCYSCINNAYTKNLGTMSLLDCEIKAAQHHATMFYPDAYQHPATGTNSWRRRVNGSYGVRSPNHSTHYEVGATSNYACSLIKQVGANTTSRSGGKTTTLINETSPRATGTANGYRYGIYRTATSDNYVCSLFLRVNGLNVYSKGVQSMLSGLNRTMNNGVSGLCTHGQCGDAYSYLSNKTQTNASGSNASAVTGGYCYGYTILEPYEAPPAPASVVIGNLTWVKVSEKDKVTGNQWTSACSAIGKKAYSCYTYTTNNSNFYNANGTTYDASEFTSSCNCGQYVSQSSIPSDTTFLYACINGSNLLWNGSNKTTYYSNSGWVNGLSTVPSSVIASHAATNYYYVPCR